MYKWSVYNFSDKEINQIVNVIKWWSSGPLRDSAYDGRKLTKQVRKWAVYWNLLQYRCKHSVEVPDDDMPWLDYEGRKCKTCGRGKRYNWKLTANYDQRFSLPHYTPHEALWRLVKPMLFHDSGETKGYSVIYDHRWPDLNIYRCRRSSETDFRDRQIEKVAFQDKLNVFNQLAKAGYIIWQTAGSVWNIEILVEEKQA